jgi:uncharacterized protein (TIGR03000 family)
MFRRMLFCSGLLLLAGAVVLVTPGLGQAQHGGGGHGGGGHGGGGHGGGFGGGHFGGGHFGGGHFGGSHFGGGHFPGSFGGARFGGSRGGVYSHPHYGGHHYGYYPYYYGGYPYLWSGADYGLGYYGSYGTEAPSYYGDGDTSSYYDGGTSVTPPATGYPSYYPSVTLAPETGLPQTDNPAGVTVKVPADAEIWFEGTKMTTKGSIREFQSPPLTPGSRYTYEVRARWKENGHEVTQTQEVAVTAGAHVNVSFPVTPPPAKPQAAGG